MEIAAEMPTSPPTRRGAAEAVPPARTAASAALVGEEDEAQAAVNRLRQIDPSLRASVLKAYWPIRRPADLATWAEGLRKAGFE